MSRYAAVNTKTGFLQCIADTKKELLEILTEEHPDNGTFEQFHIAEIIDTISISTKTIIEAIITNSEGKEIKIDSRDRVIPTERTRTSEDLDPMVQQILDNIT